jgi:hypothetical protein
MSMLVKPVACSRCHSSARQQPGEPVIESPSGMIRTGAALAGPAGATTKNATANRTVPRNAWKNGRLSMRRLLSGLPPRTSGTTALPCSPRTYQRVCAN